MRMKRAFILLRPMTFRQSKAVILRARRAVVSTPLCRYGIPCVSRAFTAFFGVGTFAEPDRAPKDLAQVTTRLPVHEQRDGRVLQNSPFFGGAGFITGISARAVLYGCPATQIFNCSVI